MPRSSTGQKPADAPPPTRVKSRRFSRELPNWIGVLSPQEDEFQELRRVLALLREPALEAGHEALALRGHAPEHRLFDLLGRVQLVVPLPRASLRLRPRLVQPPVRGGQCPRDLRAPALVAPVRLQDVRSDADWEDGQGDKAAREETRLEWLLNSDGCLGAIKK